MFLTALPISLEPVWKNEIVATDGNFVREDNTEYNMYAFFKGNAMAIPSM